MTNKLAILIIAILILVGALCYTLWMFLFGVLVNLLQIGFVWYLMKFGVRTEKSENPENLENPLDAIGKKR